MQSSSYRSRSFGWIKINVYHTEKSVRRHLKKSRQASLTQNEFLEEKDLQCCKNILVSDLNIHFIQKELFSKFVKLKKLSLHNLPLEGEAIKNSLGKELKLTYLSLENVGLNNKLLESLLPYLPKTLTLLDLKNNSLTYFSTDFISNTTVKTLNLSLNQNITMMLDKEALS